MQPGSNDNTSNNSKYQSRLVLLALKLIIVMPAILVIRVILVRTVSIIATACSREASLPVKHRLLQMPVLEANRMQSQADDPFETTMFIFTIYDFHYYYYYCHYFASVLRVKSRTVQP